MIFSKKHEIKSVANELSFCYDITTDTLLIHQSIRREKKPVSYYAILNVYINFKLAYSHTLDTDCSIHKFLIDSYFSIERWEKNSLLLNSTDFSINEINFDRQIICKIGDKYYLYFEYLASFRDNVNIPFTLNIKFEKSILIGSFYYNSMPKYHLYGPSRWIDGQADRTYISNFSLETGKELWSYDILKRFPEKFTNPWGEEFQVEVSRFIGDEPNKIWFYLNNGGVLVLDALTGKELALVGKPITKDYCPPYPEGISETAAAGYLDEKNKKVISLIDCYYHEINTEAYELTFINLKEEFEKHAVNSISQIYFDDDYIYFYDKKFMGSNQCVKIAILNRKTLKIDWSYDFAEKEQSFPMSLEVYGNKIFVVDGSQRLHIFEKEAE